MDGGLYLDKYRVDSARKSGYDYSQAGQYFITICTHGRTPYFGHIQSAASASDSAYLIGSELATQAWKCWQEIPQHFPFAEADAFVVMPDHIHGVLIFNRPASRPDQSAPVFGPQSGNLAAVVRGFKVGVKAWATRNQIPFAWQARYFDRIIRNEIELEKIRKYIRDNANRWEADKGSDVGIFC